MNILLILIKQEFILLRNKYIQISIFFILFPLFLYLFFSIPLALVFINIKPIYVVWSSSGIFTVTTLLTSLLILVPTLKRKFKSEFLFSTPVKVTNIITSIYLFALIIGLIQFIISVIIINSINNDFLKAYDVFLIFVILIPSIFIISNISIILGCFMKNRFTISFINVFLFIFISFGLGAFFPLKYFPSLYSGIFKYFPFSCTIVNIQKIIAAESLYFSYLIVSFLYAIFFSALTIAIIHNKIKNRKF